jgi:hypothetical protein
VKRAPASSSLSASREVDDLDDEGRCADTLERHTSADGSRAAPADDARPDGGKARRRLRDHGLSLVLLALTVLSLAGHAVSGYRAFLAERTHVLGAPPLFEYLRTGVLLESLFENWESEFLSIPVLVVLSIFLRQRGSSESKPVHFAHSRTGKD